MQWKRNTRRQTGIEHHMNYMYWSFNYTTFHLIHYSDSETVCTNVLIFNGACLHFIYLHWSNSQYFTHKLITYVDIYGFNLMIQYVKQLYPNMLRLIDLFIVLSATFSNIMDTSFSGWRSRSTRRESPTMGKELVNFITCGCESSAPFFVIYKAGCEPTPYWWYACTSC